MELWLLPIALIFFLAAMFLGYRTPKKETKPIPQIVYNAIETPDGTILESLSRHDYKTHVDKNGKEYMVDGGNSYLRRSLLNKLNNPDGYTELSVTTDDSHDKVREYFTWGAHGKDGKQDRVNKKLKNMSNAHINAIIEGEFDKYYGDAVVKLFQDEVHWREDFNIFIEDK